MKGQAGHQSGASLSPLAEMQGDGCDEQRRIMIIGGGPAGLSAAVYAARAGSNVLLVADELGGYIAQTALVENYLGFTSIAGFELADRFIEHVHNYNQIEIIEGARITGLRHEDDELIAQAADGRNFCAALVIVATGTRHRRLHVPGELRPAGQGVSHCAVCDGPMYAGEKVAVIGGGNAGMEAALHLSEIASKVYLIEQEGRLRGEKLLQQRIARAKGKGKIDVLTATRVEEITGDAAVDGILISDLGHGAG
ncbi:MAG: FAD-binding protein, partial [Spirochaetaceae bacterium]